MKRTSTIAMLPLVFALALTACGGDSPSTVVEQYLTAVQVGDYKGAKENASRESQAPLEALAARNQPVGDQILPFEVGQEKISGDRAIVEYTLAGNPHVMSLLNENGDWKVIYVPPTADPGGKANILSGPSLVARQFLVALHSGEVREAKQYATHDAKRTLDMLQYNSKRQHPDEIEILETKQNGAAATVHYTKNGEDRWLEMTQEDGVWKAEWEFLNDDTFDDLGEQLERAIGN